MILHINSCVRENSRTYKIASALLDIIGTEEDVVEIKLKDKDISPLTEEKLEYRTRLISEKSFGDEVFDYAKQFANADTIVISAPFWDLSFPSLLKVYIENIYITGIVSEYGTDGRPKGLCRAKKLYYVTTAGGPYVQDFSFDYIRDLCVCYFGIGEARLIKAEMLDVDGFDSEAIINDTISNLKNMI